MGDLRGRRAPSVGWFCLLTFKLHPVHSYNDLKDYLCLPNSCDPANFTSFSAQSLVLATRSRLRLRLHIGIKALPHRFAISSQTV